MTTPSKKLLLFQIHGMDCAEEITLLKTEVGPIVGGAERLSFDLLNQRMSVVLSVDEDISSKEILAAVVRAGMKAQVISTDVLNKGTDKQDHHRQRLIVLTITSGALGLFGLLLHIFLGDGLRAVFTQEGSEAVHKVPIAAQIAYAVSILAGVWSFLPKAWLALRRLRPDMNLLMVIAVAGAISIGEWFEATTVAFLFTLSLAIESWSIGRARQAVARLLDLSAPNVTVVGADGKESTVSPEEVSVGSRFLVRPGQRVALDGVVRQGDSEINQAPLTGESTPVAKSVGGLVYAGTVNGSGTLIVESTKPASDTTLAHIIRLVGDAQSQRAPSEQWVESFARYYTPAVLGLAILFLIAGPLLFGGTWVAWLYRALVLLVIACPCALVISTPVSIVAALAGATRHGVLIKGGQFVEAPARLKAIALDKTGTITEGTPQVVGVVPFDTHSEQDLLERAASLEAHSTHPLALAIIAHARKEGHTVQPAENVQAIPGKGATGLVQGKAYWIGSHRLLEERKQETTEVHQKIEAMTQEGRSVVVIGNDRHVCGFIVLADRIRTTTPLALAELKKLGIQRLIMLSGDNRATAERIASDLALDEVKSELLPDEKVKVIERLVSEWGQVAMVGDGINDAPSLARATVGIAMGGIGSDAAIETADIALMSDDLASLPWLIRHSRRTLQIIKQNIIFSLAVKAAFVVLTFAGHASLWSAIAADTGASLLVIFNGLRLLNERY
ncbi:MAG: heavy metal translocating P-type ATPase [Planctomycetia bacterium]|nr:heavy metal translocating P-type ATPase [Planctomycetia bacterium]